MEKGYTMKDYMIPIITPELVALFGNSPCSDATHEQDGSHMGCRYTKTLILLDDARYALVHSSLLIRPDHTLRPPNKASSEMLWRERTHGDPCVSSYLPENARKSGSGRLSMVLVRLKL